MTLSDLRKAAKGRFGLEYSTDEDAFFTNALLNECINQAHRWLAVEARPYRSEGTYDLPLGSGGISTVELGCMVIDVERDKVRVYTGGAWRLVEMFASEEEARDRLGVVDNAANSAPLYGWLRLGNALGGQRLLDLYPGSDAAVTDGVRVRQVEYPVLLTDDNHSPALQAAEHTRLLNRTLYEMARMVAHRGDREVIPLMDRLEAASLEDARALKQILERFGRGGPRRIRRAGW